MAAAATGSCVLRRNKSAFGQTETRKEDGLLIEVVSIRFNKRSKVYYFNPRGLRINEGDEVVVETAKGLEFGVCARGNHSVSEQLVVLPLRPVARLATEDDKKIAAAGKIKEKEALEYCQSQIAQLGLDMKLTDVEYGFEGNKILFFFTSDGRVDFRELVKDLANRFRARIELRQIGVRDEAKMLGGLGVCGKQFCCSQFLNEFHPVSIKMAKTQGLSLNPAKISGTCGRLMCCLKYEDSVYEELVKKAPKIGAFVETPSGKGSVIGVNLLRGNAKVRLEDGVDTTLKTFKFEELDVLGGKGRRAEYIAARDEGRLEEAGFTPSAPPAPVTLQKSILPKPGKKPRQSQNEVVEPENNPEPPAEPRKNKTEDRPPKPNKRAQNRRRRRPNQSNPPSE